jgi:hypothetical protein
MFVFDTVPVRKPIPDLDGKDRSDPQRPSKKHEQHMSAQLRTYAREMWHLLRVRIGIVMGVTPSAAHLDAHRDTAQIAGRI